MNIDTILGVLDELLATAIESTPDSREIKTYKEGYADGIQLALTLLKNFGEGGDK